MEYFHNYSSPIGNLTIVSDGDALLAILFDEPCSEDESLPVFDETERWLDIYFSGRDPGFIPKLRIGGTPFQTEVWSILQTIPYGQTMTYGEIAKTVAKQKGMAKMSAQAVGNAVGKNPFPIIIPCHRVIGSNGGLVGYGGGLDRKVRLLKIEGAL